MLSLFVVITAWTCLDGTPFFCNLMNFFPLTFSFGCAIMYKIVIRCRVMIDGGQQAKGLDIGKGDRSNEFSGRKNLEGRCSKAG